MTVRRKIQFFFLVNALFISSYLVAEHNFPDEIKDLAVAGKTNDALSVFHEWTLSHESEFALFPSIIDFVTISPKSSTVDIVLAVYSSFLTDKEIGIIRAIPVDWAELNGNIEKALEVIEKSSDSTQGSLFNADLRRLGLLLELGYHRELQDVYGTETPIQLSVVNVSNSTKRIPIENSLIKVFGALESSTDGGYNGALAGYGLVSLYLAEGLLEEAKNIVTKLKEKFPKSPEYFLSLNRMNLKGLDGLEVKEFVSPALLIGSDLFESQNAVSVLNADLLNQQSDLVGEEKTDLAETLFYVQIGAYSDFDNAQQMVYQLKNHGIEAKVEQDEDDLQRVIIGKELGRGKALNLLKQIRAIGFDGYLKTVILD